MTGERLASVVASYSLGMLALEGGGVEGEMNGGCQAILGGGGGGGGSAVRAVLVYSVFEDEKSEGPEEKSVKQKIA